MGSRKNLKARYDAQASRRRHSRHAHHPDQHLYSAGSIAYAGESAAWRYVEFFTANIRNTNTRRAYARACSRFFAWCEERGLTLPPFAPMTSRPGSSSCKQDPLGARREAEARRSAHAVRLAGDRPGGADKSSRCSARAEACSEDRQDAGARWHRMAQAARRHSD